MSDYVRDYSKGKIYKIVVDTEEEYKPYVGSTIEELSRRMSGHRAKYRFWKKGGRKYASFDLFEKYGVENCKIILLEEYPCDSIMKLLQKEREWFDSIECCNILRPFTSKDEKKEILKKYTEINKEQITEKNKEWRDEHKEQIAEWRDEHKEQIAEKNKEWYEANKEQIAEKNKEWYEANKEIISVKKKEYYDKHKEQILLKKKESFTCNCGLIITIGNKSYHNKSLRHQNYLSSLKV